LDGRYERKRGVMYDYEPQKGLKAFNREEEWAD
jgi:hypothetical protein